MDIKKAFYLAVLCAIFAVTATAPVVNACGGPSANATAAAKACATATGGQGGSVYLTRDANGGWQVSWPGLIGLPPSPQMVAGNLQLAQRRALIRSLLFGKTTFYVKARIGDRWVTKRVVVLPHNLIHFRRAGLSDFVFIGPRRGCVRPYRIVAQGAIRASREGVFRSEAEFLESLKRKVIQTAAGLLPGQEATVVLSMIRERRGAGYQGIGFGGGGGKMWYNGSATALSAAAGTGVSATHEFRIPEMRFLVLKRI